MPRLPDSSEFHYFAELRREIENAENEKIDEISCLLVPNIDSNITLDEYFRSDRFVSFLCQKYIDQMRLKGYQTDIEGKRKSDRRYDIIFHCEFNWNIL